MNTKVLEYILAIEEEGSISKAADRFYLAQPALSAHLKNLEKQYGAPLFRRTHGKMELTKAGILFVNNARLILHLERQLYADLENIKRENRRALRFLTERSYRNHIIRYTLPAFAKKHPNIPVDIDAVNTVQAIQAVKNNQADLALCVLEETSVPGLHSEVTGYGHLVLGFPPDYTGPTNLSQLASAIDHGLMPVLHPVGTSTRLLEERCLIRAGIAPQAVLEIQTFHNAADFVKNTNSFAFFPNGFQNAITDGLILSEPQIGYNSVLIRQENPEISDVLTDFENILKSTLRSFANRRNL